MTCFDGQKSHGEIVPSTPFPSTDQRKRELIFSSVSIAKTSVLALPPLHFNRQKAGLLLQQTAEGSAMQAAERRHVYNPVISEYVTPVRAKTPS